MGDSLQIVSQNQKNNIDKQIASLLEKDEKIANLTSENNPEIDHLKKENENLKKINEDQEILIDEQMTSLNQKETKIASFISEHNLEIERIQKENETKMEKFEEGMKKEL